MGTMTSARGRIKYYIKLGLCLLKPIIVGINNHSSRINKLSKQKQLIDIESILMVA